MDSDVCLSIRAEIARHLSSNQWDWPGDFSIAERSRLESTACGRSHSLQTKSSLNTLKYLVVSSI